VIIIQLARLIKLAKNPAKKYSYFDNISIIKMAN